MRAVSLNLVRADDAVAPSTVEDAFRELSGYVAAVATRLLGRDDEVDDVVQDVFVAAMKGLSGLRERQALKAWLATLTVRIATRRLRMRRWRSFFGFDEALGYGALVDRAASPEERALLMRVYELLDELPVDRRVAWTLRHFEGEPLEEVARLCQCSLATAKRRIAAAHEFLSKAVDRG
jgi:RNA polymerase sigma-70 factor (ECF subfamily)